VLALADELGNHRQSIAEHRATGDRDHAASVRWGLGEARDIRRGPVDAVPPAIKALTH
jgi:hypothetical protein